MHMLTGCDANVFLVSSYFPCPGVRMFRYVFALFIILAHWAV